MRSELLLALKNLEKVLQKIAKYVFSLENTKRAKITKLKLYPSNSIDYLVRYEASPLWGLEVRCFSDGASTIRVRELFGSTTEEELPLVYEDDFFDAMEKITTTVEGTLDNTARNLVSEVSSFLEKGLGLTNLCFIRDWKATLNPQKNPPLKISVLVWCDSEGERWTTLEKFLLENLKGKEADWEVEVQTDLPQEKREKSEELLWLLKL